MTSFYNKLVDWHLAQLRTSFSSTNCVFVYKGFPVLFVLQIAQKLTSALGKNTVTEQRQINLDYISVAALSSLKNLQATSSNQVMFYEEFLALSRLISIDLLPKYFVIIENTPYETPPNQSTYFPEDSRWTTGQNRQLNTNSVFRSFYSGSLLLDGVCYVQYQPFPVRQNGNITFYRFFAQTPDYIPTSFKEHFQNIIPVDSSNSAYRELKRQIFMDESIQVPLHLLVDGKRLQNMVERRELAAITFLLQTAEVAFTVMLKPETVEKSPERETKYHSPSPIDKYMTVQLLDSSMFPKFRPGSYLFCSALNDFSKLQPGRVFVFQTPHNVHIKLFERIEEGYIYVKAINENYNPVEPIPIKEIQQLYGVVYESTRP